MSGNTQHRRRVHPGWRQSLVSCSIARPTTSGPLSPLCQATPTGPAAPWSRAGMLCGVRAFQVLGEGPREQGGGGWLLSVQQKCSFCRWMQGLSGVRKCRSCRRTCSPLSLGISKLTPKYMNRQYPAVRLKCQRPFAPLLSCSSSFTHCTSMPNEGLAGQITGLVL